MDFDDLIMQVVHLFQAFPEVAEHYRRRFRHVLVDEYQDTNHAQYTLVRELVGGYDKELPGTDQELADAEAGPRPTGSAPPVAPSELTVVGDADQSIYAFRGATIRNIEEFEADYPDAHVVLLEQNYRSTQTVLDAANAVIARNPGRKDKRLWTASGRRAEDRRLRRGLRARRGRVRRGGDRPAARRARLLLRRRGRLLPDQQPVPGDGGGAGPHRRALRRRRRHPVLRAPRGQGRHGVPARAGQPRRLGQPAPHRQRAQAGDRRAGRGARGRLRREPADQLRRRARPPRRRARAWRPARRPAWRRSSR